MRKSRWHQWLSIIEVARGFAAFSGEVHLLNEDEF
jgi:hypothetical protein